MIFIKIILPLSSYVVNFTTEFLKKINSCSINDNILLASRNIASLFPSFDMRETIQDICTIIGNPMQLNDSIKTSLKAGLDLIVQTIVLVFHKEFYKQPMGAVLCLRINLYLHNRLYHIIHDNVLLASLYIVSLYTALDMRVIDS